MSTRKIEGWVNEGYGHNTNITFITEKFPKVNRPMEATLIIGGKGYTAEEVLAFINDLKDQTMSIAVEQSIDRIAAKHGIILNPA